MTQRRHFLDFAAAINSTLEHGKANIMKIKIYYNVSQIVLSCCWIRYCHYDYFWNYTFSTSMFGANVGMLSLKPSTFPFKQEESNPTFLLNMVLERYKVAYLLVYYSICSRIWISPWSTYNLDIAKSLHYLDAVAPTFTRLQSSYTNDTIWLIYTRNQASNFEGACQCF